METTERQKFIYQFGRFALDPQEKTLFADGVPVHLPAKEFETLLLLVENNGKALSKEEMLTAIWQGAFVEEGNLTKQISRLRKLLNCDGEKLIETLPKHGYRFSAEVNRIFQPAEETVLEKRTVKRLTVRLEAEDSDDAPLALPPKKSFFSGARILAGLTVLLAAVGFGIWFWAGQAKDEKINSIAVLPLKPLSAEDGDKSLGLGLADALIMKIGGLRQITVRPLSAVTRFADASTDSLEIGRRLKVDAILEGTIQQADGRVRLNARLLRVDGGEQIWAGNFEEEAAKVFDLQDRLTEQTARALKLKLGASENEQITKRFTNNTEALDAYQKGRYFWNRRTANDLKTAVEFFNEAVRKDPNYALAYAGLADAYSLLSDYSGALPDETYPKAREAAMKALELDDKLAEAHTSLAYVKMYYDRDWQGAENEFRRALALNPNYASAHQWYAEYLTAMGRFDEALAATRRAKEIDPLSPSINAGEVWTLYFARRYDEAIERGREIAEMNPNFAEIHEYLKRCYDQKGMYAEAVAARQTRRQLVGLDATETDILKQAASAANSKDYWKKRLEQELVEMRTESPALFNMAEIYAQLGEKDAAFEWLEKAVGNRHYEVMYLRVAPNLDPLRSDARFADLLKRTGLAL
jgi:DNA-binding winged helix-turn-helix (wHTH) protein/TolB-like protein/Flp pilus assembly protein TadD